MIVLDASALIAHLDANDAHHEAVERVLTTELDEELVASAITVAETLVGAVRAGTIGIALRNLDDLGVRDVAVPSSRLAAAQLASLQAETGLPLPDCCVLQAAESTGAGKVVTFDRRLARVARDRGLQVP